MTILDYGDLTINGKVMAYEGAVKIEKGSPTFTVHPQVNGGKFVRQDISTNYSTIKIPVRVTPDNNKEYDALRANGDNNVITFRDQNFTGCLMDKLPEREDLAIVDYVFFGDPAV